MIHLEIAVNWIVRIKITLYPTQGTHVRRVSSLSPPFFAADLGTDSTKNSPELTPALSFTFLGSFYTLALAVSKETIHKHVEMLFFSFGEGSRSAEHHRAGTFPAPNPPQTCLFADHSAVEVFAFIRVGSYVVGCLFPRLVDC